MESSKTIIRRLLPAAAALALFFVVSAVYFAPQFRGEVLPQHDVVQYDGMAKDINDMREATGEDPQWTGRMFGGMPAYLINVAYPAQLVKNTLGRVVKIIDTPAAFLFFAMTAMWLMLLIFGVNPWVGVVASLAYGLSTYFLLIIGAGHITKMWALVYAPLMMGGAWMTLRGNMWAGGALTALTASLEIGANHPQITYYFLLAMAAFWISEGVTAFREKHFRNFALRTAVLAAAGLLAVGSNFSPLWYTAKHSKETMRGGPELASTAETSKNGLALDYATAWSYGRTESLNLLVPDFMGRESGTAFAPDGEGAAVLNDYGLRGAAQQLPAYWGTQPYTGGPTYLGAAAAPLPAPGRARLPGPQTGGDAQGPLPTLPPAGRRGVRQHHRKVHRTGKAGTARVQVRPGKAQKQRAVASHGKPRDKILFPARRQLEHTAQQHGQLFRDKGLIGAAVHHVLVKRVAAVRHHQHQTVVRRVARRGRHLHPVVSAVGIAVQQRQHTFHGIAHISGQVCGKIQLHAHGGPEDLRFQLTVNIRHKKRPFMYDRNPASYYKENPADLQSCRAKVRK